MVSIRFILIAFLCLGSVSVVLAHGAPVEEEKRPQAPAEQASGQATQEPQGDLTQMDLLNDKRALRIGDRLRYRVIEEREDAELLFVNSQGEVQVPLIGAVPADGKTCRELAYDIKRELEKEFFYQATVLLELREGMTSRGSVHIVGEVQRQGKMPLPPDDILTVYDAILKAGGVTSQANAGKSVIIRNDPKTPEEVERISVDVAKMLESGPGNEDVVLQPEDIVQVPAKEQSQQQFIVRGAVRKEGVYQVPNTGRIMVSEAIMRAGGFTDFARKSGVKLLRGAVGSADGSDTESGETKTITVDVAAVLDRGERSKDHEVKAGDIVRVPEKWISISN